MNSIDSKEKLRIIYFESGDSNIKATVKLLKKARYLESNILKQAQKFKKSGEYPKWVKLDLVTKCEKIPFKELKEEMINTRRNHIEYGITLDEYWNTTFYPKKLMQMHL